MTNWLFPTHPEMYFCPDADRSADTSAQVGETPAPIISGDSPYSSCLVEPIYLNEITT